LTILAASFSLTLADQVSAQTLKTLYSFTAVNSNTNLDGASPGPVFVWGNTLYGTAGSGGRSGRGTIFAVSTDGSGFTNLHSFTAISGAQFTNSDGASPFAGLT
jgi:uncharacterized repeat protein (TIGR03803 family)